MASPDLSSRLAGRLRCLLLACLTCFNWSAHAQTAKIDSLRQLLATEVPDTARIRLLQELALELRPRDADQSIVYGKEAVELSGPLNDDLVMAKSQVQLGAAYATKGHLDSAMTHLELAKSLLLENIDSGSLSSTYHAMAFVKYRRGEYDTAIELYQKADQLEADKSSKNASSISLNAGVVLSEIGHDEEALIYFRRAIETARIARTEHIELRALNNIGISHAQMGDLDSGIYYMKLGREVATRLNDKTSLANCFQALGSMHLGQEKIEEAKAYYDQALAINLESQDRFALSYNYQGLAAYYDRKGQRTGDKNDFYTSLEYAQKLIDVSTEIGAPERLMMGYEKMWDGYEILGDYETALLYHKKYSKLRDSVFNERKTRQLSEMKEKYEAEERDREIQFQNEQLDKQEAVLNQQAVLRNALIGGLIAAFVIALLLYRNQRIKTRKNRQIEALLREIHHRVKNNLQVISSLLNMQSRGIEDEAMLDTIKEGQGRVKAMSLIHQKLYQTESASEIDLQEYITELADQLKELYVGEADHVDTQVSARDVKLDLDTAIPLGLILNELITNAYKYAFQGLESGKISIDLQRVDKDQLKLEVADDGQGLPSDLRLEKVKSLGLKLVNILTKQLKGSLTYHSEDGTRFVINFRDLRMVN